MAQAWANGCVFEHGLAPSPSYYNRKVGQNLYMGSVKSVSLPLYLFYQEFRDYSFYSNHCPPLPVQCGHYTQMVWATTNKVGCAEKKCQSQYYVVCHYHPPGNFIGQKPYKNAAPCSQCGTEDGGLCHNNLCVTNEVCRTENLQCSCSLKCHNGGVLDRNKCTCQCKDGWDGLDCSALCRDEHIWCHKSPGFPDESSCPFHEGRVRDEFCRKMCKQCNGVGTDKSNTYCDGKLCDPGSVLNSGCSCEILCPGPRCGSASKFLPLNSLLPVATIIATFGFTT